MTYWLCVTNEENWQVLNKRKIWGVSDQNRKRLIEVKVGDMLVFYVKPKKIAGVYRVIAKPFQTSEKIFSTSGFSEEETFPYRVKIKPFVIPEEPVSFENFVATLSFISKKKAWPAYLRKGMQVISREDYERILSSLKASS